MNKKITLILSSLVFLASCASPVAPGPTATPVPSSTPLPSATATSTPEPSPTATSTPTETPMPVDVADFTPENTPQSFEHLGMQWTQTVNEQGETVWAVLNPDGTRVAGMEHVTMQHIEGYYGSVEMFGVVIEFGDKMSVVVTPKAGWRYDFSKSGDTMQTLGAELWEELKGDAEDDKIKQALNDGAPIRVFLGSYDKATKLPASPDGSYPLRSIYNETQTEVLGNLVCSSQDGVGVFTGPMVDEGGEVVVGVFYVDKRFDLLEEAKSDSIDVVEDRYSPFVALGVALRWINMVEGYSAFYADKNPADVVDSYAEWVKDKAEVVWDQDGE